MVFLVIPLLVIWLNVLRSSPSAPTFLVWQEAVLAVVVVVVVGAVLPWVSVLLLHSAPPVVASVVRPVSPLVVEGKSRLYHHPNQTLTIYSYRGGYRGGRGRGYSPY